MKEFCLGAGFKTVLTGHSARADGATDAIRRGVDLKIVKDHGRWRSDAVFLYIQDDTAARLQVSVALGGYHSADRKSFSAGASSDASSALSNQAGVASLLPVTSSPSENAEYWRKVHALSKAIGLSAARDALLFDLEDSDL